MKNVLILTLKIGFTGAIISILSIISILIAGIDLPEYYAFVPLFFICLIAIVIIIMMWMAV